LSGGRGGSADIIPLTVKTATSYRFLRVIRSIDVCVCVYVGRRGMGKWADHDTDRHATTDGTNSGERYLLKAVWKIHNKIYCKN